MGFIKKDINQNGVLIDRVLADGLGLENIRFVELFFEVSQQMRVSHFLLLGDFKQDWDHLLDYLGVNIFILQRTA